MTRPMTAVRGAGYTSQRPGQMFDPLNQSAVTNIIQPKEQEEK